MNQTLWMSLAIFIATTCCSPMAAQSTFDLEPPVQANTNSAQVTMSPDPDALPVFKFATAEIDEHGNIRIATKSAKQELVAPMESTVPPELDPKGIRYTENATQRYVVMVPYTEKDEDGNEVTKTRTETRTRQVPVTRYRKRNAQEQKTFEKRLAEHKAKKKELGEDEIAPAVATPVTQEYQVHVPYSEEIDGKRITKTRTETRTRTITVYRGKTETTASITARSYKPGEIKCYDIEGNELDEETVIARLSERKPVILLNSTEGITPFFETLLNPDAIFVIEPKN